MKISNETKVGSLTAIAIVILVLGFNYLKGKSFTGTSTNFYASFSDIQGLAVSNPVVINGKQVGSISKTDGGLDMKRILVSINMKQKLNIPDNSIAMINKSLLGIVQLDIKLGNSSTFLKNNDSLKTEATNDILDEAMQKLDPVLYQVKNAVKSLDSVLVTVNSVLDPASKSNLRAAMANLNLTTSNLTVSSASLQKLLNTQTGALAKTLNNVSSFTGNLAANNEKLNDVMVNMGKATENLSRLDLEKTLNSLNETVTEMKNTVAKLNSNSGTVGMLLNDPRLYNNLAATANKINILLDDLKTNPKRYVSISIFGKKNTNTGLATPLPDTMNAPYFEVKKQN
jgi:phospholipid/cholesterol/gamma-HCH transport system substrate-binding protein